MIYSKHLEVMNDSDPLIHVYGVNLTSNRRPHKDSSWVMDQPSGRSEGAANLNSFSVLVSDCD